MSIISYLIIYLIGIPITLFFCGYMDGLSNEKDDTSTNLIVSILWPLVIPITFIIILTLLAAVLAENIYEYSFNMGEKNGNDKKGEDNNVVD